MTTNAAKNSWQYLEQRPHPWRKQLYIKGKKIKASVIYSDMAANNQTPAEAAENWNLPLTAIREVIKYCETHRELLKQEAEEGRRLLKTERVKLEPEIGGS